MRKLIYISLIALAGCTTELTGPQAPTGVTGSDMADYFWHDSTYHYQSSTGLQTIQVQANGTIVDYNPAVGQNTFFSTTKSNGAFSLSGFSPSDIFGLDPSLQVVPDTIFGNPWTETIRSIAAVNSESGSYLFAASDSVLYQVTLQPINSLVRLSVLPVRGLTLVQDVTGNGLYAYQKGGDTILWTDDGYNWLAFTAPTAGITAFASSSPTINDGDDLFWVACGANLYQFSSISKALTAVTSCPLTNIVALEANRNGVIAGGDNGQIYEVSYYGSSTLQATVPGTLDGIAAKFASTSSGVYDFTNASATVLSGNYSTIYSTGVSIFAAQSGGAVDHFALFGAPNDVVLPAPNGSNVVTQFALPSQGPYDPNSGVFALAGTQVYYRQNATTWVPVNQTVVPPPALKPGSLTLLDSNSSWIAGYIERNNMGGPQHSYTYYATSSGPVAQVKFGGATYNNVLLVNYVAKLNGMTDSDDVPQYNIYFEKGLGPVVIQRSENGSVTTTTLVK